MTLHHVQKICINCPAGCHLDIHYDTDSGHLNVQGNRCPRGQAYAQQEMTAPKRIVTAVVFAKSPSGQSCIPVKSSAPLPKEMIPDLLKTLFSLNVQLPIHIGQVIIKNYLNSAVDIVATDNRS